MKTQDQREARAREDQAAEWVVRRDAGFASGEQADFKAWLAADPRHGAAFAEMEAALHTLGAPRQQGRETDVLRELKSWERGKQRPSALRRPLTWATLGLAAAAMVALAFLLAQQRSALPSAPGVATMRLQPERQQLQDGSMVELNANSAIDIDFTAARRDVRLVRGEAHFAVAKDAVRPFVVAVGNIEVRAVGTAFAVRLGAAPVDVLRLEQVEILVTEGRVAVQPVHPPDSTSLQETSNPPAIGPVLVSAGSRLAVSADGTNLPVSTVEAVTPVEITTSLAWREARFEFTNTPLSEAVALFNRKSRVKLVLEDAALSDLRVSGIYWADNADGFARLIESSLDIQAIRDDQGRILLHRRR